MVFEPNYTKVVSSISHFATRNCMNIEGLSDKIVKTLFD